MAAFAALKQCSTIRKYAVFGYIRQASKNLSLPYLPALVYICLSYYSPNMDFFNECNEENVKLSNHQMTATVIYSRNDGEQYYSSSRYTYAAFGYHWIDSLSSKTHEWIFKINKISERMEFGLVSESEGPSYFLGIFCKGIINDH